MKKQFNLLAFTFLCAFSASIYVKTEAAITYNGPTSIEIDYTFGTNIDYELIFDYQPALFTIKYYSSKGNIGTSHVSGSSLVDNSDGTYTYNTNEYFFKENFSSETDQLEISVGGSSFYISTSIDYPIITNNKIKSSQTVQEGTAPNVIVNNGQIQGGNNTYSYRWQYRTNNSGWTNIPSENSNSYLPGVLYETTRYRRIAKSSDVSIAFIPENFSNEVVVTVQKIQNQLSTSNTIYCSGDTPSLITGNSMQSAIGMYEFSGYLWEINWELPSHPTWWDWQILTNSGVDIQPPTYNYEETMHVFFRRTATYSSPSGGVIRRVSNVIQITYTDEITNNLITPFNLDADIYDWTWSIFGNEPEPFSCVDSYQWQKKLMEIGLILMVKLDKSSLHYQSRQPVIEGWFILMGNLTQVM